jgi:hypothetical protein
MTGLFNPLKFIPACTAALVVSFLAVACQTATTTPVLTPVVQTIEVTRETTQEATRTAEVPATVTPTSTPTITQTPSLTSTVTRTPTITLTPEPPVVTILVHAACNFGPGGAYLWKYGLLETTWMEVLGRNEEGSWLFIQGVHGWNPCWVKAEFVSFNDGGDVTTHNLEILPVDVILPFATNLYRPPTGIQAFRYGNEVKIFWNAVWMTEDDYRGYLIEVWLCQGGRQVFKPISWFHPLCENMDTLVLSVTDELGCQDPSHARIYTAEKHGYTGYIEIPWPALVATPKPTP